MDSGLYCRKCSKRLDLVHFSEDRSLSLIISKSTFACMNLHCKAGTEVILISKVKRKEDGHITLEDIRRRIEEVERREAGSWFKRSLELIRSTRNRMVAGNNEGGKKNGK